MSMATTAKARTRSGAPSPTRGVQIVFPGDARQRLWSGIPHGLARGVRELGIESSHVSAELPRTLGAPVTLALSAARIRRIPSAPPAARLRSSRRAVREGSSELAALRSLALRRRLRRIGDGDAVVQIGTGYAVPSVEPVVTLEDMTIAQAVALKVPEWRAQPERCLRARAELQRRSYDHAIACCVASDWAARSLIDDYGVPSSKVHVVGLGRNHDPRPAPRDWTRPRFLFVGQDWTRKGGPELLLAFRSLRDRVPEATLDVVGEHPRLDIDGVRGHGPLALNDRRRCDSVLALFESATCCVMPSRFEPFGIVHVEAAAAGVPSIGTTVGGAAHAIGPDGGRLVPPEDVQALLGAMLELSNADTAMRMGAAALERSERFTWQAVARRVLEALE
jgi:glycosyltransferase involved in cell wall biosynthesis